MKRIGLALAAAACLAFPAGLRAAPIGYSISDSNNVLYQIDLATGLATALGVVPVVGGVGGDEVEGLARLNSGQIVGVTEANNGPGSLFNLVGPGGSPNIGLRTPVTARVGDEAGAAVNPVTGVLYNIQNLANIASVLYTINPNTGFAAIVGVNAGVNAPVADGLAISNSGQAFASDGNVSGLLYSLNLSNGNLTPIGSLGLGTGFDSGLAIDPATGVLYLLRETGEIYTVNTATGAATFQAFVVDAVTGQRLTGDFEGLEIALPAVPAPAGLVLLVSGAAAALPVRLLRRRAA